MTSHSQNLNQRLNAIKEKFTSQIEELQKEILALQEHKCNHKHNIECSICLEAINEDKNVVILECGHKYHLNCFMEYGIMNKTKFHHQKCCLCRKRVLDEEKEDELLRQRREAMEQRDREYRAEIEQREREFREEQQNERINNYNQVYMDMPHNMQQDILNSMDVFPLIQYRNLLRELLVNEIGESSILITNITLINNRIEELRNQYNQQRQQQEQSRPQSQVRRRGNNNLAESRRRIGRNNRTAILRALQLLHQSSELDHPFFYDSHFFSRNRLGNNS